MSSNTFGPYVAILSARFRALLQYRAAAVAGLWTQVFFGLVLIMVYEAFYRSSADRSRQPMTLPQIVSYVWLGQALLAMLPWNADAEVRAMVRSGAVAYELCRPMDLYLLWFARALALRTAPTILRAVPMTIFAMLILPMIGLGQWRLLPPTSLAAGGGFILSMFLALLLGCAITTLINISLMWTVSGDGIIIIVPAMVSFLSGMIIPLPLFPQWSQTLLHLLPFAGLIDLPFRTYNGDILPSDLGPVLLLQLAWTVILILLGRWLMSRGVRRLVIQGG